ncbi:MAG TPA: (2Fe-2S) ferredoxin domain-containing protein [Feifaniaceae bacterium]|nr:(2Fe-2S) ferredoxin domain-containing protein [Feifaniaceae bacterium]
MKITVCIGSSCHLKGSRLVVEQLQALVAERKLEDRIELCGAFCMGNCTNGVSVKVDGELFPLKPGNVAAFFEDEVVKRLEEPSA